MGDKKVVKKIKFAKRWLEKAEEAYLQGRSEEGFLSLSLAEAEIRTLQKGEWSSLLKGRRSFSMRVMEVFLLVFLILILFVSYTSIERVPLLNPKGYTSFASLEEGIFKPGRGETFSFSVQLPNLRFSVHGKMEGSLSITKALDAHVLYVVQREKVKSREELKVKGSQELTLSADELVRLIELGKKELKVYLTGGR